jgi:hypothetical protein
MATATAAEVERGLHQLIATVDLADLLHRMHGPCGVLLEVPIALDATDGAHMVGGRLGSPSG